MVAIKARIKQVKKNSLVIRSVPPDMGSGVDQPCEVQRHGVSRDGSYIPRRPGVFPPYVHRYHGGKHKAEKRH